MSDITPRKGPSAPRNKLAALIREQILSGEFEPGDSPPSERSLADLHQVHRQTVARAYTILAEEGLVKKANRGWRVCHLGQGTSTQHATPNTNPSGSSLLSNAILVLTNQELSYDRFYTSSGNNAEIIFGSIEEIDHQGANSIVMRHDRFMSTSINDLVNNLGGIAVPDTKGVNLEFIQKLKTCKQHGLPVVVYGDDPYFCEFERVSSDHFHGAGLLVDWILSKNKSDILFFSPEVSHYWSIERERGFVSALQQHKLSSRPTLTFPPVPAPINELPSNHPDRVKILAEQMQDILKQYFKSHGVPEVLMCISDGQATYAAMACRALGIAPQSDIIITGYDNFYATSPLTQIYDRPPAVTVDKQNKKIGRAIIRRLTSDHINSEPHPVVDLVEPELLTLDQPTLV